MDEEQTSDQQKAMARKWGKRLDRALKERQESKLEKRLKKLRRYVRGEEGDDGEKGLVRTNIIHANFAAILPQVYAKNPEIAVTPSEAASDDRYAWVTPFCKTMQAVMNRVFVEDGKLKQRAKAAIRSAMTTGFGWAKLSWQKDIRRDPLINNRIADTQDNLQRVRKLLADIREGDGGKDDLEAKQGELEQQLKALQEQAEVSVTEGIVVDRLLTEDMFILDDTLFEFDGYEQAEALAHRVWMTCEQYEETFGKKPPKTASKYGTDKREASGGNTVADQNDVRLVAVFEVWNRRDNTVYTLCAGADEWAREPYVPEVLGKRFYPFFALAFNPVDGRVEPVSDTEMLIELQDEYNTTRTNFAEHRRENLPVRVYRKGGALTDNDVAALANRQSNQWVGIEGDPMTPVQNDIAILPNPPVDPATYDVSPILRDAEMVMGAGDAAKGTINKAKTATEAEIMAMGLQSRVAERQDVVEDWIADMARFAAELCLQELTPQQVQRIAGKDAVWPQMSRAQVFDIVHVQVRAGSVGRPNKAREREQWAQMLPQIQQAIQQTIEARAAGQNDLADTIMKLMEETLRRFDERIDIEQFMPPREEEGAAPAQIPPEVQQQMQQAQEAMQAMQQEIERLAQIAEGKAEEAAIARERLAFDQAKAGEEIAARREDSERQSAARIEEARIRAEMQAQTALETERLRAETEAARLASEERIALAREMLAIAGRQQAQQGEAQASQQVGQSTEQLAAMLQQMQQALAGMGEQFAAAMTGMQAQITAPKRVLRDENGDLVGVETVMRLQ